MPAGYFIDKVPGDRAFVAVKYIVVCALCGKLEKEMSCLVDYGDLPPARFAVDTNG